jgi:hypothetical protein
LERAAVGRADPAIHAAVAASTGVKPDVNASQSANRASEAAAERQPNAKTHYVPPSDYE